MSDACTGWPEPTYCRDCNAQLSAKEVEHGLEGFGHQGRCCDCYDKRMRGPEPEKTA